MFIWDCFFFNIILPSDTLSLPDFRNQSMVEAINQISRLGLQVEIKRIENNPNLPPSCVIQQDPLPGTEVKKNHKVKLVVNRGEEIAGGSIPVVALLRFLFLLLFLFLMFRQMSLEEAQSIIESSGLKLERVVEVTHDTIPAGYVVSQNPPSESQVAKGSTVSLLVSKRREKPRRLL